MKNRIFTGSGVAIVTPFINDKIDYDSLEKLINYQIDNGTQAIVICGTTGEASTLSDDEHMDAIAFAVEKTAHRVPVIAGTGSNHTEYSIMLSKHAQSVGADGLLLVTPYYNKTTQKGLVLHFNAIADAVEIPIILYNVPGRTNLSITPETYFELSKHPNIVATKEANGLINTVVQTMALCGGNLDVYAGNDDWIVPVLSLGGAGVISVVANILPAETQRICSLFFEGKIRESAQLQMKYIDLIDSLFCEVNPIPIKAAVEILGLCSGEMRLPLCEIESKNRDRLKASMKKIGLI